MTDAYLYLNHNEIEEKSREYSNRISTNPNFEALAYLKNEYGEILNEYDAPYDCAMNAEGAIGFWMRRYLNENDELIWSGFDKIMTSYDGVWYQDIIKKYR